MTIIGYQGDPEPVLKNCDWYSPIPCRDGYHVWLTSSNTTTGGRIQEGQRCACGAMEWRGDHEAVDGSVVSSAARS